MHPKLQHYVPQFYLRNFANKRKKQYFVCCFDKATRKTFKPNTKNVAGETHYYDFSTEDGKRVSIESFLSGLETRSQVAFEAVISNPSTRMLQDNKSGLADFIAFQESRTAVFRAEHLAMIGGVNSRLGDSGVELPTPTENEVRQFQALFLIERTPLFAQIMLEMKWILVVNETGRPFWTSDSPVFRYNPHESKIVGNLGLTSAGIQLHVPLSSTLGVVICDPREYADLKPEVHAIAPNVDFSNSGQVLFSRRYLFSVDDDFQLADDILSKNPEYGDPDRLRMVVS